VKSVCSKCKGYTNQRTLFEEVEEIHNSDDNWWETHKYQIIKCEGCDTVSFRKLYNDAQRDHFSDYEDPWSQEVYPKRDLTNLPLRNVLNIPRNIRKIYQETIGAFNNDQNILCAAGLRAIIEGICIDKDIAGGHYEGTDGKKLFSNRLHGKIEGLYEHGFLTKPNSEILHALRFLGNEAVHVLASPSSAELSLAIDLVEHTIDNIYEIQHKAKKLKQEMAKRSKR
jgi:hypothetical protein